jgi:hypothetical protein
MRRVLLLVAVLAVVVVVALIFLTNRTVASPEQPIPFSHRNHVEARDIACAHCHRGADTGMVAGIPELEVCMGCHAFVGLQQPGVQTLRDHFERQEPVQWVRLTRVPDHVVFYHSPHIRAGVDCLTCHARGAPATQWFQPYNPSMGWCLSCHRNMDAPTDCWTCHR